MTNPSTLEFEISLSALIAFNQSLMRRGQLNREDEKELNTLLRDIEKVLHDRTSGARG